MAAVTGDADGVRKLGRTWAAMGHAADVEAARLGRAAAAIPAASFAGPAGDRMRAYLSTLQAGTTAMAAAYDRVASAAPRVAEAIEHARNAERSRDEAREHVARATKAVEIAQTAFEAAQTALSTHHTTPLGLVGAPIGPSAAELAALAQAEHRLSRAQRELDDAQRALRAAEHRFQDADDDRERASRAYAALCRDQAAVARQALPPPPKAENVPARVSSIVAALYGLSAVPMTQLGIVAKYGQSRSGPRTPAGDAFYDRVSKWARRMERIGRVGGIAVPVAAASIKAFTNPDLTGAQRQDQIVRDTLPGMGAGMAGAWGASLACAQADPLVIPVCGLAGGIVGGLTGQKVTNVPIVRDFNKFVSHTIIAPFTDGVGEIVHAGSAGELARGVIDTVAAPADAAVNVATPIVKATGTILNDVGDALAVPGFG
jgi:hypothetical protein